MKFKPRVLSWISLSFFTLYLLTFFTDDTLRVPHSFLHHFREFGILLFLLPTIFISYTLRRTAEQTGEPVASHFWLMMAVTFAATGSAAVIELAIGATTPSALATPSVVWILPVLMLAIGARMLWIRRHR